MSVNGDGGAGFPICVQGTLRVTDASLAGYGISELSAEATACFGGLQAVLTLQDYQACQGVKILTDSKPLIQYLAQGPARQTDTICSSIWTVLATIGSLNLVNIQWIPEHVGLEGNTEANLEARRGITLPQSLAPMNFIFTCAAIKQHQQRVADNRYRIDPHDRIHAVLAGSVNQFQCWQWDWAKNECITVAQLRTRQVVILHCWQDIFTVSGARTPPPVHNATALTRRQSTWCYSVQLMTRPRGTSGKEKSSI